MARKKNAIISLKEVSLTYPGPGKRPVSILEGINLDVKKGEAVSIVGPSGSGKTSLLMLIAGVEQATGGEIMVAGKNITSLPEDALSAFRHQHIGIIFQNFHLIPTMTALENVAVGMKLMGVKNARARALEGLKAVGLKERVEHYPSQLSGGEQQRVAIARAYATHPSILLADEPTGNLDGETGKQVISLLFDLRKKYKTTLLLITHDKELARKTSRQLVMRSGKLYAK